MVLLYIAGAAVILMTFVIILMHRHEKRRRQELKIAAESLNLSYSYYDPFMLANSFAHLNHFAQGINRYAFNVIHGRYEGHSVLAFDYHYAIEPQKKRRNQPPDSYVLSVLILMLRGRLPAMVVRPRVMESKFAPLSDDFQEIQSDSLGFASAYVAKSTDADFGHKLLRPEVTDYVVKHPGMSFEIHGNTLLVHLAEIMTPELLESQLKRLVEVFNLIPEELIDETEQEAAEFPGQNDPTESEN